MRDLITSAAQGELLFTVVETIPSGLTEIAAQANGDLIVGHSETGHHHVMRGERTRAFRASPTVLYLDVGEDDVLRHLRHHDTHEPFRMRGGLKVRINVARQATPRGWEAVRD